MPGNEKVIKSISAGFISGLVASWVMNKFQEGLAKVTDEPEKSHGAQSIQPGAPKLGIGAYLQEKGIDDQRDNAAERTANAVSIGIFDRRLSKDEKDMGGRIFHYAFGAVNGAVYGAAAQIAPPLTVGAGLPFGAAIWLAADEGVVPALGLSKLPHEYPPCKHVYALMSHLIYGLTTHVVFKILQRMLK